MTNTPIQSDEELQQKIGNVLDDLLNTEMPARFHNTDWAEYTVGELIKAYSEQIALEFGVQLLKETIQEAPVADYEGLEGNVYNARHPNHKYMLKKIAKLKAQLTSHKEKL